MKINHSTYTAIMMQATRAAQREGWLADAADALETAGIPAYDSLREKFEPFAVRLLEATEGVPDGKGGAFKDMMFARFQGEAFQ